MTDFFPYENLTWPEVAALPRDVPLVLPFGGGWDLQVLAAEREVGALVVEARAAADEIPLGVRTVTLDTAR